MITERLRLEVFERDEGMCQYILPDGHKCLRPASDCHHRIPKGMGGRPNLKETIDDLECRCYLHNHAILCDGKYHLGHTK